MNPLLIRRRGMMQAAAAPPADGQLEWLETDGVAYINTTYIGRQPRSVKAKVKIPQLLSTGCLIGCEGTSSEPDGNKYIPLRVVLNPYRLCFGYNYYYNGGSVDISQYIADGKIIDAYCKIKTGSQVLGAKEEGGGSYATYSKTSTANISSNYNMYIFACNRANTPVYHCENGTRILEMTIYSDFNMTTELLTFKPWRLNGEVGLMDMLTNTFYGNAAGSGAFIGGPNVI